VIIASISINHKKTPVAVREKVAFSPNEVANANNKLLQNPQINACVILATCNRLEIYISTKQTNNKELLAKFLADFHNLELDLNEYLDYFENETAVKHITQVASGLDSLVLGEPQILGQLKDAYNIAKKNNQLDKILEKLFQHAFFVAKKVRSETDIGKNPVSIAYCGVKLSEKIFSDIHKQTALLIGAGEMIELSAKHLAQKNVKQIIIANRTAQNAQKIVDDLSVPTKIIALGQLSDYFYQADIVISSTAAPIAIIGKGLVERSIKKRKHKPIFILDIAIPRDVEAEVAELNDVFLYTVDDLKQVVRDNEQSRNAAKQLAISKINELNQEFIEFFANLNNQEIIKNYYQSANNIKISLIASALKDLQTNDVDIVINKLADQLTNKLLHQNLTNLKALDNDALKQCHNCIPKITNE
jgi:glutamyl-tRNA reductase